MPPLAAVNPAPETPHDPVLERVVERLSAVPGVVGIALGGSRAREPATPGADVDIGIYYRAADVPAPDALRAAAADLDDRGEPDGFGSYGEWGPWINGGAWLRVDGLKTDFLVREIERVEKVLDDCEAGKLVTAYQPGHPHCFVNHIYAGEVHDNVVLFDPEGAMEQLRSRTDPYPEPLADATMRTFDWEAEFALETAGTAAGRGDVVYVGGCLFRSIACMVQALFAANRSYLVNEKGAVRRVDLLTLHPEGFGDRAASTLARRLETPAELEATLADAFELQRETRSTLEAAGLVTAKAGSAEKQ